MAVNLNGYFNKCEVRISTVLCYLFEPIIYSISRYSEKFQIHLFMFHYHHRFLPSTVYGYFHQGTAVHNYYTRILLNFRTDVAHTRMTLFSIKCSGPSG